MDAGLMAQIMAFAGCPGHAELWQEQQTELQEQLKSIGISWPSFPVKPADFE